ncbi:hypothetical protein EVA_13795 [gut metagenome]|uniref:Uncharacterized protein n=1 Tax=gut metagenome TaxID=749906 RepID=J9GFI9_9ZZZZ
MHFLTGMHIISVQISTKKENSTDLNGFFCKGCGKFIVSCTYIRLQCVGKHVHSCIRCNGRRNAFYQLCIQDRLICCKAF